MRQPRGGRELADVVVGSLGLVAHGQRVFSEGDGGAAGDVHELPDRERAEGRPHLGLSVFQQVAPHEAGVGLAQARERLLRAEVGDGGDLHARVRAAPPEDWKVEHQYTPSTTDVWKREKGRTLRTPSHG